MRIKGILCVAILVSIMAAASAHALGLEVAVGGWRQDPGGDVGYEARDAGDLLNVENELKYGSESRLHGRAKIDMPLFLPNIYLMAAPSEFDGTGLKTNSFSFGGETFEADVPFYSKVKMDQYDVALFYGLPVLSTATLNTLNIDIGINVRLIDLEAEVRQTLAGIFEKEDVTVPVPMVFLGVQLTPLDWLAIEAEGRGLSIGGDSVYSLIGRIRFKIAGPLFIAGGYRYDRIDVDEDDIKIDLTLKGPFAEVGLKF